MNYSPAFSGKEICAVIFSEFVNLVLQGLKYQPEHSQA